MTTVIAMLTMLIVRIVIPVLVLLGLGEAINRRFAKSNHR